MGVGCLPFFHGQVEAVNDVVASFLVAAMAPFTSRATGLTDLSSCTAIRGGWREPAGLVNNTIYFTITNGVLDPDRLKILAVCYCMPQSVWTFNSEPRQLNKIG